MRVENVPTTHQDNFNVPPIRAGKGNLRQFRFIK